MLYFLVYIASHPRRPDVLPIVYSSVFRSPYTLPSSVSRKSCICHSCSNCRGVYQQFPFWSASKSPCFGDPSIITSRSSTICQALYLQHLRATPANVANKGLTAKLNPLYATFTRNWGGGYIAPITQRYATVKDRRSEEGDEMRDYCHPVRERC